MSALMIYQGAHPFFYLPPCLYGVVMTAVQAPPTPVLGSPGKKLSPLIRLDLFPAQVTSPDNSVYFHQEKARVIVTTDGLFIFVDSPQGPAVALKARLSSAHGNRKDGYTFTYMPPPDTATEPPTPRALATLKVVPGGGCGCGSRLRSFTPWAPMRYTNPGPNLQ